MEQGVPEGGGRAARDMGGAVHIEGHPPTVWVLVALHAERVFGGQERAMNLARNDATKAKEAAHARSFSISIPVTAWGRSCFRPGSRFFGLAWKSPSANPSAL